MLGYGVAATAFSGLAIVLVIRRETGVLKRLRATPLPAPVYIAAVLLTTLIAFAVEAIVLVALAMVLFDAEFPRKPSFRRRRDPARKRVIRRARSRRERARAASRRRVGRDHGALPSSVVHLRRVLLAAALPGVAEDDRRLLPLTYFIDLMGAVMLGGDSIWDRPKDVAVITAWGIFGVAAGEAVLPLDSARGLASFKAGTRTGQWGRTNRRSPSRRGPSNRPP